MNYSYGDWDVKTLTVDTITTPKTLTFTDLDYAHDYAVKSTDASEGKLVNVTGSALYTPEELRFAKTNVSNIYRNTEVQTLYQADVKTGVRTLSEVKLLMKATNNVSGKETLLPLKGWMCLEIPMADVITNEAVDYLRNRVVSVTTDTGSVNSAREQEIARGALMPER